MKERAETLLKSINSRIEDADATVKEEKVRIEYELKNFDDWSATAIEYYAMKMRQASDRKRSLLEQKHAVESILKED